MLAKTANCDNVLQALMPFYTKKKRGNVRIGKPETTGDPCCPKENANRMRHPEAMYLL